MTGTLHPSPHCRPHRITLAVLFKDVLAAQPPRYSGRAETITRIAEMGIFVREESLGCHPCTVRSRHFGNLCVPFQRRQFVFLADLIDRLENALLDRLPVLRITGQGQQNRDDRYPDHSFEDLIGPAMFSFNLAVRRFFGERRRYPVSSA